MQLAYSCITSRYIVRGAARVLQNSRAIESPLTVTYISATQSTMHENWDTCRPNEPIVNFTEMCCALNACGGVRRYKMYVRGSDASSCQTTLDTCFRFTQPQPAGRHIQRQQTTTTEQQAATTTTSNNAQRSDDDDDDDGTIDKQTADRSRCT